MPIPRSGRLWRRIFVVLLVAVVGAYVWYAQLEYPHGGSPLGLIYGILGFLLILLLAFFGIRKRWYRSTFGTLEQWLQSHIYLGLLTLVILALHTGGRLHDAVAVTALALLVVVVFSGIAGAILYATIPRRLTEVESNLTAEELSDQINQMARNMARIASERSAAFQRVYEELLQESKPRWLAGWRLLLSKKRQRIKRPDSDWTTLLGLVPRSEQDELRQMLVVSRQRSELLLKLIYQQRYKNMLEAWLYVHVPVTIALLLVAAAHVVTVFYYGRLQ
jgi:predicted membrane channel-forming protein YqfA (hemolysin III family)